MVKEFLSRRNVPYVEKDVSRDGLAANELVRMGQRGVPVTLINGQMVVGYDPNRIGALLASQPSRPSLGVSIADAAKHAPAGSPPGAYIGKVKPNSPAAHAGLQEGDIILQLDGWPVHSADDVFRILDQVGSRRQATVRFYRNGVSTDATLHW